MNVQAWIAGHKGEAAGIGGAAAVGLYALYRRHQNTTGAGGTSAGLPGGTAGTSSGVGIAGLSGAPDTTLTDMQNTLQDQLNTALGQFQSNVNSQISAIPAGPRGPAGPAGPRGVNPIVPTVPRAGPSPAPRPRNVIPTPRRTPTPPRPAPRPAAHQNYTVRPGDTLTAIARRFGISLGLLESRNKQIANPNLIRPGQTVHIR